MRNKRKSPRAKWVEYNQGEYFITVCTHKHTHYLGEIIDSEIHYTPIGYYLIEALENASIHCPYIEIIQFTVMPNHFHAIVNVNDQKQINLTIEERMNARIHPDKRTMLSIFVGGLKASVTRFANKNNLNFAWQGRFHDHVIRGVDDRNNISQYIEANILNWEKDCFNM